MFQYTFHIQDVEFNDNYEYIAHFLSHEEAGKFIGENLEVGNAVLIVSVKEVPYDEEIFNRVTL